MGVLSKYIKELGRCDSSISDIDLYGRGYTDAKLMEIMNCLLVQKNGVMQLNLAYNKLTDESGVKLARYVTANSTIRWLILPGNRFGSEMYLALAKALRVNSSLQYLYLNDNQTVDQTHIDAVFINTLRLNPDRPTGTEWRLYSFSFIDIDFKRLRNVAEKSASPSMLEFLLCVHSDTEKIETKNRWK